MPGEQASGAVRVVLEGHELQPGASAGEEVRSEQRRRSRLLGAVQEYLVRGGRAVDVRRPVIARRNSSRGPPLPLSASCRQVITRIRLSAAKKTRARSDARTAPGINEKQFADRANRGL